MKSVHSVGQSRTVGQHDQLGTVTGVEFGEQVADVGLHRRVGDDKSVRYLEVGQTQCHGSQHLLLALSERRQSRYVCLLVGR